MDQVAVRLRIARESAGFSSAADAANRFGWVYSTYAGHENGSRGILAPRIREYAAAFRASSAWLLDGDGDAPTPGHTANIRRALPPGLSEPEAALWIPRGTDDTANTAADALDNAVAALCLMRARAYAYRIAIDIPAAGIAAGDLLIVDHGQTPRPGDIVLAALVDPATSVSRTAIRGYYPPYLVPPGLSGPQDVLDPTGRAAVMGVMIGLIRPPEDQDDPPTA